MEPANEMPFYCFSLQMMRRILVRMCKCLICACRMLYVFKYEMVVIGERREPEEQDDKEGKCDG